MSRRDAERLQDILEAITAIESHLTRGDLSDGLIFDAVRVRLIEIGEAIKTVSTELLDTEPGHPWSDIARMRDRLAHRYFDTNHGHVSGAVHQDLEPLKAAAATPEPTSRRRGAPRRSVRKAGSSSSSPNTSKSGDTHCPDPTERPPFSAADGSRGPCGVPQRRDHTNPGQNWVMTVTPGI